MRFEGRVIPPKKGEKFWSVVIADLKIYTQGRNEKDAYTMAKDALECLVDEKGFHAYVKPMSGNRFSVAATDIRPLIARYLQVARSRSGLTIQEVADRMGVTSRNAYAQYEQGKATPSLEKLTQILQALDPEQDMVFKVKKFA